MKRLFFFTLINFDNWKADGICKKILSQVDVFRQAGYFVELSYFLNMDTYLDIDGKKIRLGEQKGLINKGTACRYILDYIMDKHYDAVYIRYGFAEKYFYRLLKEFRKKTKKIVIEVPTYPYDREFADGFDRKIILLLDKCYRNRLKKYVYRIATFSDHNAVFGIPTIHIMNGIDFNEISARKVGAFKDDSVNIIAVAAMSFWHGYDRLLEGVGIYYHNHGIREVTVHMVGDGPEIDIYKKIVKKWNIENHIIFWGIKQGEELDAIYNRCNIAAEAFGLHRKDVAVSSSLKSREYAAKGLPIITSCEIDIFLNKKYPYIYRFPEDETPIDINRVILFYDRIYKNENENHVVHEIRNMAWQICNIKSTMLPVIQCFKEEDSYRNG